MRERVPGKNFCQRAGGWCEPVDCPGERGSRAAGGKPSYMRSVKPAKKSGLPDWAAKQGGTAGICLPSLAVAGAGGFVFFYYFLREVGKS